MHHARDRPMRAGAHVGGGPGDRAGDAEAAEGARGDVGDALRHQLGVRAVPPPGHPVRHHRREQQLDRPEQRKREGVRQHGADLGQARGRQGGLRKPAGNAAEPALDRRDRQVERAVTTPPAATTISIRGQCGTSRFSANSPPMPASEIASVAGLKVGSAAQSAGSFSSNGPGSGPISRKPKSGAIWLAKMMAAIPAVKPTVTG